ncbi:hypothetical protein [Pseudomonas vanderleydeniana]|uniref:Uncharacterized protein n=1 Tax=Pseudomonas vanderleydeniana TaxID=2745495 RepID=A0A9E6TUI8_9PSED|nr:hypothetical protein [Pseudomonas vanderleydeniana]QXI30882.1 hypothetical protein HU752_013450 [Pseudomonas vanderleydeniana]
MKKIFYPVGKTYLVCAVVLLPNKIGCRTWLAASGDLTDFGSSLGTFGTVAGIRMSVLQEHLNGSGNRMNVPSAYFALVPGLAGLGQAWRVAANGWGVTAVVGEGLISIASLVWAGLVVAYLWQAVRHFDTVKAEFLHPVQGGTPALLAVDHHLRLRRSLPNLRNQVQQRD